MKNSKQEGPAPEAAAPAAPAPRISNRALAVIAGAAVALAVALYGFQAGWFASSVADDPAVSGRGDGAKDNAISRQAASTSGVPVLASWDPLPAGAPVAGVGPTASAEAPSEISVPADGARSPVGVRLPLKRPSGGDYTGYSLELRSGTKRVWGTYMPNPRVPDDFAVLALSFDAGALRAGNVDTTRMTLAIMGAGSYDRTRTKSDSIGEVRLTLQ